MYKLVAGRTIIKDGKELCYLNRTEGENSTFNMTPCECDAMAHFLEAMLNTVNFKTYYKKYMKK